MTVAKTIAAISSGTDQLVVRICDRRAPLTQAVIDQALKRTQFSIYPRQPTQRGEITDLDLLSLLQSLRARQAHIALPRYGNMRPWQIRSGEQHVGTRRYGKLMDLVAHRRHPSFAALLWDESVVRTGRGVPGRGGWRSYVIADHAGQWHHGWHGFAWQLDAAEQTFMKEHQLLTAHQMRSATYLHPERRQSLFGQSYLTVKPLWRRLDDEIAHYTDVRRRQFPNGNPNSKKRQRAAERVVATGLAFPVSRPTFEVSLLGLSFSGTYPAIAQSEVGYQLLEQHLRRLRTWRTIVQFVCRAAEVAFYQYGYRERFIPWWVGDSVWQPGPHGLRLQLDQSLALVCREDSARTTIAAD